MKEREEEFQGDTRDTIGMLKIFYNALNAYETLGLTSVEPTPGYVKDRVRELNAARQQTDDPQRITNAARQVTQSYIESAAADIGTEDARERHSSHFKFSRPIRDRIPTLRPRMRVTDAVLLAKCEREGTSRTPRWHIVWNRSLCT